jgi:hypothetical protein
MLIDSLQIADANGKLPEANCTDFTLQAISSDTRFIRFASKADSLDDLLSGSRAGIESNPCTLRVTGYSEVGRAAR